MLQEPDDLDQNNPIDMNEEAWLELYGTMEDFEQYLDHDHQMDY